MTVKADQPFVHFSSNNFMFAPVPVGLSTPPIQDYAFYNGGSVNATYEIDLSSLDELNKVRKIFICCLFCLAGVAQFLMLYCHLWHVVVLASALVDKFRSSCV